MTIEEMETSRRRFIRSPRPRGRRLSAILRQLAGDRSRERISIGDLFEVMGDRATGALMLVFAIPNLVPTPPGTSAILGAPLLFLAAQLTFGLKPWLPKVIAGRSMKREDFEAIVSRIHRWLAFAERMLQPRLSFLVEPPAEYLVGFLCLVLAVILTLPIPLGNILPAFTICLFSFGILGKDGLSLGVWNGHGRYFTDRRWRRDLRPYQGCDLLRHKLACLSEYSPIRPLHFLNALDFCSILF